MRVKQGINAWQTAAGIEESTLLRSTTSGGKIGERLGECAIWSILTESARRIGIERFGAHDLRRTCAKLCRKGGGLEQTKFLLAHSSIKTAENSTQLDLNRLLQVSRRPPMSRRTYPHPK